MAGNPEGGKLAAATNKQRYGEQFYTMIGRKGGLASRGGGFGSMTPERVRQLGRLGGQKSRRNHMPVEPVWCDGNHVALKQKEAKIKTRHYIAWSSATIAAMGLMYYLGRLR